MGSFFFSLSGLAVTRVPAIEREKRECAINFKNVTFVVCIRFPVLPLSRPPEWIFNYFSCSCVRQFVFLVDTAPRAAKKKPLIFSVNLMLVNLLLADGEKMFPLVYGFEAGRRSKKLNPMRKRRETILIKQRIFGDLIH